MPRSIVTLLAQGIAAAIATSQAAAQETTRPTDEIVVLGDTVGELGLGGTSSSGSRLDLSVMETPATVEIIDSSVLRARGYQRLTDAVQSLPGVISGDHPASPSTFSVRGFTGQEITILRDGLWIGPSSMTMRPQNTFNLERVEMLRGPSSVLNGQGAVASTVNTVSRSAEIGAGHSFDALASYGRFDSYQLGIGTGGPLGENKAYRLDLSRHGTEGYVERMDAQSTNLTASLAWQPTDDLTLKFSTDYLEDDVPKYFGTPLVPFSAARRPMTDIISAQTGETIDEDMRFRNYNVEDGVAQAAQWFLRADVAWQASDRWSIENTTYSFDANREWINAEGYAYCTTVVDVCTDIGDLQRYYGYFFVFHDQELMGNRFTASFDDAAGRMNNRFLAGHEITSIDFVRSRGFRRNIAPAPSDSVDPYAPIPGFYGPLELRGVSPTDIQTRAVFAEDALEITERMTLVTALRYEELDLDRKNFNQSGVLETNGFARNFDWWSRRIGAVYELRDDLSLYGQYTNATDPIGSNLFLVNSNNNFDLTDAEQWEIGLKANLQGGRKQITLAYFDISREDILERFALDSATNVGGVDSRGIEVSATIMATDRWRIGANAGYTDAEIVPSANIQALAGNRPSNVPEWTANAWTSVSNVGGLPLEIGGALRFVDDRFGERANLITFESYSLLDAYVAWTPEKYRVTLRVDNLTDEPYVAWSDLFYIGQTDPSFIYANQVMLGAPRSYSVTFQARF